MSKKGRIYSLALAGLLVHLASTTILIIALTSGSDIYILLYLAIWLGFSIFMFEWNRRTSAVSFMLNDLVHWPYGFAQSIFVMADWLVLLLIWIDRGLFFGLVVAVSLVGYAINPICGKRKVRSVKAN